MADASPSCCANCDEALAPLFSFACADCPDDLTPCCTTCAIALHAPPRSARHQLVRRDTTHLPEADSERVAGHGFCARCRSLPGRPALAVQLAVLECEGCASEAGGALALCLDCDEAVHASLDMDAHTRLYFVAQLPPLQSALYTLGGVDGVRICHQDAMESYAGRVWPGSMMLARYLEQRAREQPDEFRGKTILELGCGCAAIPSFTCWLLGASRLLCTDMNEDGLAVLADNIASVQQQTEERGIDIERTEAPQLVSSVIPADLSTRRLAFGEPLDGDLIDAFDVILGSYILYDPDSIQPLVHTLDQLVPGDASATEADPTRRSDPLILLTSHEPTREGAFLGALESRGFTWHRVPFSLQTAQLSDDAHTATGAAHSSIGTGLRSTSILVVRKDRRRRQDEA